MTIHPVTSTTVAPISPGSHPIDPLTSNGDFDKQLKTAMKEDTGAANPQSGEASGPAPSAQAAALAVFSGYINYVAPASTQTAQAEMHSWAPYAGPKDDRDGFSDGTGQLTASGSPRISMNAEPVKNQYDYAGPAASNPYFTSPSNPLRPAFVLGFQNWFQENSVLGGTSGPVPLNKIFNSTAEGAEEALRLVQQFSSGAKTVQKQWEGGVYAAAQPTWVVELEDGRQINAGAILHSYYNQGHGVSISSDAMLTRSLGLA